MLRLFNAFRSFSNLTDGDILLTVPFILQLVQCVGNTRVFPQDFAVQNEVNLSRNLDSSSSHYHYIHEHVHVCDSLTKS